MQTYLLFNLNAERGNEEDRRTEDGNTISAFPPLPPPWVKRSRVASDAELTPNHPVFSFLTCQTPATCLEKIHPQALSFFNLFLILLSPSQPPPNLGGCVINLGDALRVFRCGFPAFCHPESGSKQTKSL